MAFKKKKQGYLKVDMIERRIRKYNGVLSHVAESLGVTPAAITMRIKRNERLQKAKEEATLSTNIDILDIAEENIFKRVREGDYIASKYVLEKLGRNRGYADSKNINIGGQTDSENGRPKKVVFEFDYIDAGTKDTDRATEETEILFQKEEKV